MEPADLGARDWAPHGLDGLRDFDPSLLNTTAHISSDEIRFDGRTLKVLAEKWLIRDDLLAERLAHNRQYERTIVDMDDRVRALEHRLERVEQGQMITPIDLVETNPMNQTKGVN